MRKCRRCDIVFHSDKRLNCLYCDSRLMDVDAEAVVVQKFDEATDQQPDKKEKKAVLHERMQYLVGSYFRTKTLSFLYDFSRNELKRGEKFRRFLVQPLNFTFIIKLPWLFADIIDSLFFRFLYAGYCPECGWKFKKTSQKSKHSPDECEYNREYAKVLAEILNGGIVRSERDFEEVAHKLAEGGKSSAYHDLCTAKRPYGPTMDIITILVSVAAILYFLTVWIAPIFSRMYDFYDL